MMVAKNNVKKIFLMAISGLFMGVLNGCSSVHPVAPDSAINVQRCDKTVSRQAQTVPGTGMAIGANWGRMLPMTQAVRRAWPTMDADYYSGVIKHNPIYLSDLDAESHFRGDNPSLGQEGIGLANIPWFYANLAITPILMCVNPPLTQVCSVPGHISPIYQGYLPLHGAVGPVPTPGRIDWPYPVVHISGGSPPKQ